MANKYISYFIWLSQKHPIRGKYMKKQLKDFWKSILYLYTVLLNPLVRSQRKKTNTIPVIIINFNQLENLKKLVNFLVKRDVENIIIIDNQSNYPPLLDYYKTIQSRVSIEFMDQNYGHMVFFENEQLQKKYGKGYYFITDADILPNPDLPEDFVKIMIRKMDKYNKKVTKIGFALDIDTIPDYYPLKEKVIHWEQQYWTDELEKNIFFAAVDTTFALYKPGYPIKFKVKPHQFYEAIRIAGTFTCKHMGWYLNPKVLTDEQMHYMRTSSTSNSWKFDDEGNLDSTIAY